MISCSTMNDWDVSEIIDKTERWLFDVEDNSDEKEENCPPGKALFVH